VPGLGAVVFRAGESVRTEISCKYDRAAVADLFASAGLRIEAWRQDAEALLALALGAPA
jgi:L-histidine N-alpha-methyltransferase